MSSSLRTALLQPRPRKIERVEITDFTEPFYVRLLSSGERDAFEREHVEAKETDFRARLVAYTACDQAGERIFSSADVESLSAQPGYLLDPLVKVAVVLNKLSGQDIEDLRKN